MILDPDWRISSDQYQFILEQRTTVAKRDKVTRQPTGEVVEEWKVYGYYGSVDQLARAIATKEARTSVAAVETFQQFHDLFTSAMASVRVTVAEAVAA